MNSTLKPQDESFVSNIDSWKNYPVIEDRTRNYWVIAMYNDEGVIHYYSRDLDIDAKRALNKFHTDIDRATKWHDNFMNDAYHRMKLVYKNVKDHDDSAHFASSMTLVKVKDVSQIRRIDEISIRSVLEDE